MLQSHCSLTTLQTNHGYHPWPNNPLTITTPCNMNWNLLPIRCLGHTSNSKSLILDSTTILLYIIRKAPTNSWKFPKLPLTQPQSKQPLGSSPTWPGRETFPSSTPDLTPGILIDSPPLGFDEALYHLINLMDSQLDNITLYKINRLWPVLTFHW